MPHLQVLQETNVGASLLVQAVIIPESEEEPGPDDADTCWQVAWIVVAAKPLQGKPVELWREYYEDEGACFPEDEARRYALSGFKIAVAQVIAQQVQFRSELIRILRTTPLEDEKIIQEVTKEYFLCELKPVLTFERHNEIARANGPLTDLEVAIGVIRLQSERLLKSFAVVEVPGGEDSLSGGDFLYKVVAIAYDGDLFIRKDEDGDIS